mmetsp:Transcript_30636/g.61786  ORF Transcript_30636/g.61786 Transcript_30636/m.61786 type:complete len:230 (-) Transcript_30636:69-758(-)
MAEGSLIVGDVGCLCVFALEHHLHEHGPDLRRRLRVLSGEKVPLLDHARVPVVLALEVSAGGLDQVFEQERHHLCQPHCRLLAVREPCHRRALEERLACRRLAVLEAARPVAHRRNRLPGSKHFLDHPHGRLVVHQVPVQAVPARIEDAIHRRDVDFLQRNAACQCLLRLLIGVVPLGIFGLESFDKGPCIDGAGPSLRVGQSDFKARILHAVVGSGELVQPETSLFVR